MDDVLYDWQVVDTFGYGLTIVTFALGLRWVMTLLRAAKTNSDQPTSTFSQLLQMWGSTLWGFRTKVSTPGPQLDYWHPFILGVLELAAYPILYSVHGWEAIGAWVGLKTLAQWKLWGEDRAIFNIFLIGNALNLLVSVVVLAPLVTVTG